uniref:Uncharacterized protein LOC104222340 n=1 Tax=Nicotiana sylvestris TaxID=4096 RepID=A0A1U7WCC0_NICSY
MEGVAERMNRTIVEKM